MIVTMQTTAASQKTAADLQAAGSRFVDAVAAGMIACASVGADVVTEGLQKNQLGVRIRTGGLAKSISSWWIDREGLLCAMGVSVNSGGAYAYACILNYGGTIKPVRAKMLSIPITEEAKQYASPRDMQGLQIIRSGGKLLLATVRQTAGGGEEITPHWVLVPSVVIPAFGWFEAGIALALQPMVAEFDATFNERIAV